MGAVRVPRTQEAWASTQTWAPADQEGPYRSQQTRPCPKWSWHRKGLPFRPPRGEPTCAPLQSCDVRLLGLLCQPCGLGARLPFGPYVDSLGTMCGPTDSSVRHPRGQGPRG